MTMGLIRKQLQSPTSSMEIQARIERLCLDGVQEYQSADSRSAKFVWGVLLIGALGMTIFQCVTSIDTFRQSPVLTTTQLMVQEKMPFPDIYVCPMNAIDGHKIHSDEYIQLARKYLTAGQKLRGNRSSILSRLAKNSDVPIAFGYGGAVDESLTTPTPPPPPPDKAEALFDLISYEKSMFIVECSFDRSDDQCDQSIFIDRFDQDFGRCFLLPGKNFNQSAPGRGLTLILDIHRDRYHHSFRPLVDGVKIIATYGFDPTLDKTSTGVFAAPGYLTDIALSAINYRLISISTGFFEQRCQNVDDPEKAPKFKYSNLRYTRTACSAECVQQAAMAECACLLPIDHRDLSDQFTDQSVCTIDKATDCSYMSGLKRQHENISRCIRENCLAPCTGWEIDYRSSSLPLNEQLREIDNEGGPPMPDQSPNMPIIDTNITDHLSDQSIPDMINITADQETLQTWPTVDSQHQAAAFEAERQFRDMVIAKIAFNELRYTQLIQSQSMTVDTFIANIGGQLGLWIGASIISMVQVAFLAIDFCRSRCKSLRSGNHGGSPARPCDMNVIRNQIYIN